MDWEPTTGKLWTAVNERDELGNDLVPDYMTSVTPGGFYGWPYSYYGQHVDTRVSPQRSDLVAKALTPDYAGCWSARMGGPASASHHRGLDPDQESRMSSLNVHGPARNSGRRVEGGIDQRGWGDRKSVV